MAAPCCRETSSDWIGETQTGSNGPSSGFVRFPRTSPGDSLQVPLPFPCASPAGFLQFSGRAPAGSLADSLQVQPGSFLAVGLQRSSRPPAVASPRATFIPPQPLAVHPSMKCIPCFAAAGRPFCIVLEPWATLFLLFWTPGATFPGQW